MVKALLRIKSLFFYILSNIFGYILVLQYLRKDKRTIYFITENNLGDLCINLSFLDSYRKIHNQNHITVLLSKSKSYLIEYYIGSIDKIIYISRFKHMVFMNFFKSDLGYILRKKNNRFINTFCSTYIRSDYLENNSTIDVITLTKNILRIPLNSRPVNLVSIQDKYFIDNFIDINKIQKNNTVILNPYANSINDIPISLYEDITIRLNQMGYKVFTSVIGTQKAIKNTFPVKFQLNHTIQILNYCGYLIGTRSGFFDLSINSSALICVIDSISYKWSDFYRLSSWNLNEKLYEFRYKTNNYDFIVKEIIELFIR